MPTERHLRWAKMHAEGMSHRKIAKLEGVAHSGVYMTLQRLQRPALPYGRRMDPESRQKLLQLSQEGYSRVQIASLLGYSPRAVDYVLTNEGLDTQRRVEESADAILLMRSYGCSWQEIGRSIKHDPQGVSRWARDKIGPIDSRIYADTIVDRFRAGYSVSAIGRELSLGGESVRAVLWTRGLWSPNHPWVQENIAEIIDKHQAGTSLPVLAREYHIAPFRLSMILRDHGYNPRTRTLDD